MKLQWCIYGLISAIPFIGWSLFDVGSHFGFDMTYFFVTMFLFLYLLDFFRRQNRVLKFSFLLVGVMLLGILCSALAVVNTDCFSFQQYFKSLFHLLFFLLFFIGLSSIRLDNDQLVRIFAVAMMIGCIVSIYGMYQSVARMYHLPFAYLELSTAHQGYQVSSSFGNFTRISSFFSEPSWLGHYLGKLVVILAVLLLESKRWPSLYQRRRTLVFLLSLFLATLLLSFSFGAFVVVGLVVTLIFVHEKGYRLRFWYILFTGVIVIFVVNMSVISLFDVNLLEVIYERGVGILSGEYVARESAGKRTREIMAGVQLFQESPFWGVGMGHSKRIELISNVYALQLGELGLFGSFCFFVFWLLMVKRVYQAVRISSGQVETNIYCKVFFYLLITDLLAMNFTGDAASAKNWLDFGLAVGFSSNILAANGQRMEYLK